MNQIKNLAHKLLLIDGLGATASFIGLYFVVGGFEDFFGLPKAITNTLAIVAAAFAVYSFCAYMVAKKYWRQLLKVIAIANICYCVVTIFLVVQHKNQLTIAGLGYFLMEVIIISILVYIELLGISAHADR